MDKSKKKTDSRVIKTCCCIEETFLKLLTEVPFEKLTTSRLIKECMISKGIFYAHYLDKYDLAEQLIDRKLKFFENLLFQRFQGKRQNLSEINQMISQAVEGSRCMTIFERIQLPNRKPFILELQSVYQKVYQKYLQKNGYKGELKLQSTLFSSLVMSYISYICQGNDALSAEEISREIGFFFENIGHSFPKDIRQK